jgi:hypothetical protein
MPRRGAAGVAVAVEAVADGQGGDLIGISIIALYSPLEKPPDVDRQVLTSMKRSFCFQSISFFVAGVSDLKHIA